MTMREILDQINNMKINPIHWNWQHFPKNHKKNLIPVLKKSIMNLVNTTISTGEYPKSLKCAKVIPILKPNKQPNDPLSYRCVNILPSLAKIIDRNVNIQITQFPIQNNLLLHQHNSGIKGRSTMTMVIAMLDKWTYSLEKSEDSGNTNIRPICHIWYSMTPTITKKKLQQLGFQERTMKFFKSYLQQRTQQVIVDSFSSDELEIGPLSVCQGSTLSGLLYLIFTLDYPIIHQDKLLTIPEYIEGKNPKTNTFVDNSISRILLSKNHDNNTTIKNTLNDISDYMNSNKLVLKQDKSKLFVLTQEDSNQNNISIPIQGRDEPLIPTRTMTYLGIDLKTT